MCSVQHGPAGSLGRRLILRVGGFAFVFLSFEVSLQALFQFGINLVGHAVEVSVDFRETAGVEFESGQVQIDPFAFGAVAGDFEGVFPGGDGVI